MTDEQKEKYIKERYADKIQDVEVVLLNNKKRIKAYRFCKYDFDNKKWNFKYFYDEEMTQSIEEGTFDLYLPTPYELFGVECENGWDSIIKPLFDYIENYNKGKEEREKIVVEQVKEKFGGLRFYTNFVTTELSKIISDAEEKSYNTCEICGSTIDVGMVSEGWLSTKCHKCIKENVKKNGRPTRWRRNSDGKLYWINPFTDDELFNNENKF